MKYEKKIEIELSKRKLAILLLLSITFVFLSCCILIFKPEVRHSFYNNPILKNGVSIAGLLFFGLTSIFFVIKLMDKKMGLIIDETGITDNASGVSAGYIPWGDINEIATRKEANQDFIMVKVTNPEDYINKQKGIFKKNAMKLSYKYYGSPISISANGIKIKFRELKEILEYKLGEYKRKENNYLS